MSRRTYTSKNGEEITVSDEHIKISLLLAEELRRQSPSGRISWVQHKKMMAQEGFDDSDSNENYRQLIKYARKEKGLLPSVAEHADLIATNKLESIKEAIGDIRETQLSAREDFNRLNKMKREWTRDILLIESIQNSLKDIEFISVDYTPSVDSSKSTRKIVAAFSDLHYGYVGENYLNKYDTEIAENVVMAYADKLIKIGQTENVDEIYVVNLGDLVEGNLRNQSIFDTQQNLMEQAVKATNLVIKFLVKLSQYFNVKYSAIAGNHDRLTQNAKDNLNGDDVIVASNAIIKTYCELSDSNISFIELQDNYFGFVRYFGLNILCVHGHQTAMFKDSTLSEMSSLLNTEIDVILAGHFHKYLVREVGNNKYMAIFGSMKGIDDYSIKIGKGSSRSQGILIIDTDGNFDLRQIKL